MIVESLSPFLLTQRRRAATAAGLSTCEFEGGRSPPFCPFFPLDGKMRKPREEGGGGIKGPRPKEEGELFVISRFILLLRGRPVAQKEREEEGLAEFLFSFIPLPDLPPPSLALIAEKI